ncbi:DUF4012 domain-containing protein [Streptomyces sp. NBC_00094]|uniref:DUF4012 domain-containing protein n=1 Tax=Streptomyces sp. NBC_00094 TaxID=2903620 RepID=UPI0022531381|nr:DUF4012 domain-containing protein [Streptomyces sp. NBC_00094]MCX5388859.1 DUF4012 domain-containing protein [Streptomyces sp. NBC_00094]
MRRRIHGPLARKALLAAAVLPPAAAAWIVATGWLAANELRAAHHDLNALRESVAASTSTGPSHAPAVAAGSAAEPDQERLLRSAAAHAARAHDLTTGPAWYTASQLPFLGRPFETVRGIANASHRLAGDVLPPLVRAVPRLSADAHASGVPHALLELEGEAPAFARAARVAAKVRDDTTRLPRSSWLPAADRGRAQLSDQLDRLVPGTRDAAVAASVMPSMLGAHGPRRYFLAFQNTAEARGTGGLPGAFAVLRADRGRLSFERFGNNTELDGIRAYVNLGAEFADRYGNNEPGSAWANSNMSPHFPYAARMWSAYWRAHTGQRIDGAIAIDPGTLSLLLRVTGPARLPDGTALTADNVMDLTERTSYAMYADTAERKAFFVEAARAAAERLMGAVEDPKLLPALLNAVRDVQQEGRMQVWSADPAEEQLLAQGAFGGTLPDTPGPFAGLVVNNAAGTKLDYYLDRSLVWAPGACTDTGRSVTATVTLTNRAPTSGLPEYVTQRVDAPPYRTLPGDNRLLVDYYAGQGATLEHATLDGRRVELIPGVERGHPVYTLDLELPRQSSRTLVLHLREPEADRAPTILRQALVTPLQATVKQAAPCPA